MTAHLTKHRGINIRLPWLNQRADPDGSLLLLLLLCVSVLIGRSNKDHVFDQRIDCGCTIKTANHCIQSRIEKGSELHQ